MGDAICLGGESKAKDYILEKALELNVPIQVYLELTYRCNEKCVFCYNPKEKLKGLPFESFKRALDELADMGALFLQITGGEPLTHPDFFDVTEYAVQLGYTVVVFTNGTLINERVADRIADLDLTAVHISIHGADAETHERLTQIPGSFQKMLRGVRLLRERGVPVVLKTPITRWNQHQLEDIRRIAKDSGCDIKMAQLLTGTHDFELHPLDLTARYEDLAEQYRREFIDHLGRVLEVHPYDMNSTNCSLGRSIIGISPDGDIYPCPQLPYPLGNIQNDSIREIWEDEKRMAPFRMNSRKYVSPCKDCQIASYCSFCPGIAYLEHQNPRRAHIDACRDAVQRYGTYQKLIAELYMKNEKVKMF